MDQKWPANFPLFSYICFPIYVAIYNIRADPPCRHFFLHEVAVQELPPQQPDFMNELIWFDYFDWFYWFIYFIVKQYHICSSRVGSTTAWFHEWIDQTWFHNSIKWFCDSDFSPLPHLLLIVPHRINLKHIRSISWSMSIK